MLWGRGEASLLHHLGLLLFELGAGGAEGRWEGGGRRFGAGGWQAGKMWGLVQQPRLKGLDASAENLDANTKEHRASNTIVP